MREIAALIMASRWRAALVAAGFGLLGGYFFPLLLLSAASIGLVTLRRGGFEGMVTILAASVIAGGVFLVLPERPGFSFPLVFALWPPVWIGALALRYTASQGISLTVIAGLMLVFVAAMHLATGGEVVDFWRAWLERAIANVPGATVEGFDIEGTLRLMNGLVALMYAVSTVVSLFLARWWQAILYHPGGFQAEFCQLKLPRLLLPLWVGGIWLAGYLSKTLLIDGLLVAMAIYLFQGLAVLHTIALQRNLSNFWLIFAYGLLIAMPQYALLGLALVGAIDSLLDLRSQTGADEKK